MSHVYPRPSSAGALIVLFVSVLAGVCLPSSPAMSSKGCEKTKVWTGAHSTGWGEPGNWRPLGVPGPADRALFDDRRAGPCVLDCFREVGAVSITPGYAGAVLDLGGYTLTVYESFEAPDAKDVLKATGPGCVVDMRGTGRIRNPNAGNRFATLKVGAAGQTTTLSGPVHTGILELGDGRLALGPHTLRTGVGSEDGDRVLVASARATVEGVGPGQVCVAATADNTVTMDGYNGAQAVLGVVGAGSVALATRALSARALTVWAKATFDAAGHDVSVAGQLTVGVGMGHAMFRCGSGTVTVGSLLMPRVGKGTLDLDSCAFQCAGAFTVAGAAHTIVPGASVVDFCGDKPQRVLLSGEPLGSVRVSNSRGWVTFLDQLRVQGVLSASAVSGSVRIKFDERAEHSVASFAFTGSGTDHVILRSEVEGDQVSLALGNCATVDHVDVRDNGLTGARVNATDPTNRNSGKNSSNWVFATPDTDGDGIPDLIEEIVGTNPQDPDDCPLLAIPDGWVMDPSMPTTVHYDYSHIPVYSACPPVRVDIADGSYDDILVPIVELEESADPSVPSLQLPEYNELLGMVFDITGAIRTNIVFCFPIPPEHPSWLSKEFLTLQRHDGAAWHDVAVQALNGSRVYATLSKFSPYAIYFNPALVLCVDVNVVTPGAGWDWGETTALNDLCVALALAPTKPQVKYILVAKGTYVPSAAARTFDLPPNVTVYGGFPEKPGYLDPKTTQIHCRNPRAFPTVLSGDIGVPGDKTDNSYHVVTANNNATLDGFTITGGYANFRDEDGKGGGIYSDHNTNFTVANCVIEDNFAGHTWAQNLAGFGGGAYFGYSSGVTVRDCIFRNNTASNDRATHGGRGGGMYMVDGTSNRVVNCLFTQNTAVWGGGMTSDVGTELRIENCVFDGNRAGNGVSGPYGEWGGGYSGGSTLSNCTFVNNHADAGGGAIRFSHGCEVVNGIFWGNTCTGGGMGGEVRNDANGAAVTFAYTDIQGGVNGTKFSGLPVVDGGGNKAADPQFLDMTQGDFRLRATSPCIDAGYAGTNAPSKDFYALLRYDEPAVANTGSGTVSYYDMGAFEVTPAHFQVVTEDVGLHIAKGRRLAIADVNGDDYPDIFAVDSTERMQYLYLYNPATRKYVDADADPLNPSGIRSNRGSSPGRAQTGGTFADVDNDGDLDHFSFVHWMVPNVTERTNELLLNDGNGRFTLAPEQLFHSQGQRWTSNGAFVDYDRDGNIDIFASSFYQQEWSPTALRWQNIYRSGAYNTDRLYRGVGSGNFADITPQTVLANYAHVSYSATAMDVDGDGLLDLLSPAYRNGTASPLTISRLYSRQGGGPLAEVASPWNYEYLTNGSPRYRGSGTGNSGMGSYPRDFDNDGDEDLLEVVQHGTMLEDRPGHLSVVRNDNGTLVWDEAFAVFPNIRFRNGQRFNDEHYGSWCDMDNDGLPDLVLSVGYQLIVMRQRADHTFERVSDNVGTEVLDQNPLPPETRVNDVHDALVLDYDLDGDLDVLLGMFLEDRAELLENKTGNVRGNWVEVALQGRGTGFTNKSAIGSKVVVRAAGGATYTRYVYAGNGTFGPQEPLILHFGLGDAPTLNAIDVTWQDGPLTTNSYPGVARSIVRIRE